MTTLGDSAPQMFLEERRQRILEILNEHSAVRISELAPQFNTSTATIRKDLEQLERDGKLRRTHGGAIKVDPNSTEVMAASASIMAHKEKVKIGRAAAAFVQNNDTFIVQAGTTDLEFIRALRGKHNLTVITNDLLIASECESISPDSTPILVGGSVRVGFHYTEGSETNMLLEQYHASVAYMCTNAFSFEHGFSTHRTEQASWLKTMYRCADRHIMLIDSSKFGINALAHHNDLPDFDVLVTDSGINEIDRSRLSQLSPNTQIVYA